MLNHEIPSKSKDLIKLDGITNVHGIKVSAVFVPKLPDVVRDVDDVQVKVFASTKVKLLHHSVTNVPVLCVR